MGRRLSLTITSSAVRRADSETAEPNEHALSRSRTGSPPDKQMTLPLCPPQVKRKEPYFHSATVYSGLHLYEEIVFGSPLPLRERDRVRGKGAATSLLIQTKNALINQRLKSLLLSRTPHDGGTDILGDSPWSLLSPKTRNSSPRRRRTLCARTRPLVGCGHCVMPRIPLDSPGRSGKKWRS